MCGIIGYIETKKGGAEKAKAKIARLLEASETRGTDATGIAFVNKGKIKVYKQPVPAHEFVADKEFKKLIKEFTPKIMIGHTRAKTQGDPKDNNNNHPIVGKSMAIVHNGTLYNEGDIFKDYKLKRAGEVDSEVIVRLVEHFKDKKNIIATRTAIQCACKKIRGNMAVALINAKNSRELHLICSGNPVVLAYQKSTGNIFFGSTVEILQQALYSGKKHHNFFYDVTDKNDYLFRELATEEAVRLTADKTSQYKIERFVYEYSSSSNHNYGDDDYSGSNLHKGEHWDYNKKEYVKDEPKQTKLLKEGKADKKFVENYSPRTGIKKPSQYKSDDLITRAVILRALDNKKSKDEQSEYKRIMNALVDRFKTVEKHDPKKIMRIPEIYPVEQVEERLEELYQLDSNATMLPEEANELVNLEDYFFAQQEEADRVIYDHEPKGATPTTPETTTMADNIKNNTCGLTENELLDRYPKFRCDD